MSNVRAMARRPVTLDRRYAWAVLSALVCFACVETVVFGIRGLSVPAETEALWAIFFGATWAWWVYADRRVTGTHQPFEFEALVFFGWPLAVPYYLLTTRTRRSRAPTVSVWLLFAAPWCVAGVVYAAAVLMYVP